MERLRRLILPTLLALAAYFAVFGGEYSIFELERIRATREARAADLERTRRAVDSLTARADSLENDRELLERIAREQHGMVREGEVLYRFVPTAGSGEPDGEGNR